MKSTVIGLALLALPAGCGSGEAPGSDARPVGGPGTIDGRFVTPRALALDPLGPIYVVDKTGRIQRFSSEGAWQATWRTPAIENGLPTSLAVDRGGRVWVADTHYHRVLQYSPDGELLWEFGRHGTGPGEFIFPAGVAIDEDGTIYVSEFGGNDRIQVFDRTGKFLRAWGRFGDGPDEFRRPQALAFGPQGALYVADAVNHRIVVYDRSGRRTGGFGRYGAAPGEFKYPFGLCFDKNGTLYVAEQGNHRIQRLSAEGRPLDIWGRAGANPGELSAPWSVAVAPSGLVVVCDTGNHRLQFWIPSSMLSRGAACR